MPHGTPDWWGTEPTETIYPLQDVGELAARLGSIVTFDRRGNVFFISDFEAGIAGIQASSDDAASTLKLSTNRAASGSYSVKFDPRGVADSYVRAWRLLSPLHLSRMGMEAWVSIDPGFYRVRWLMYRYDGTTFHQASLQYDHTTEDWSVIDENSVWQTVLSDSPLQTGSGSWMAVKLVADFATDKYVRALIGNQEVDLSAYSMRTGDSDSPAQFETRVSVYGSVAAHEPGYVDNWIITQNEP